MARDPASRPAPDPRRGAPDASLGAGRTLIGANDPAAASPHERAPWWTTIGADLRFAVRALRKDVRFALLTVLTLGLGLGASTALYSVVEGVLLRPLDYPEPERLVRVWQVGKGGGQMQFSEPNFRDFAERSASFAALAAFQFGVQPVTVADGVTPETVASVSAGFFETMAVAPASGRRFTAEEIRAGARQAVVSESFWRSALGSAPPGSGSTARIGDEVYDVVGVMPAGFDYPGEASIWIPRIVAPVTYRTGHNWQVVGRLGTDVSLERGQLKSSDLARQLQGEYGDDTAMADAAIIPLRESIVGPVRPALLVLLGGAAFLLLIGCANAVNLQLAREAGRRQEIGVRRALGAGSGRLARQFLAESVVIAALGGLVGVALAATGIRTLLALEPGRLPRLGEVGLDASVVAFAGGLSLLVAVVLGLTTAYRAARSDLTGMLSAATRSTTGGVEGRRAREGLMALQIALTLVLLVGSGLLVRSFVRLIETDPGYRTTGVAVVEVLLPRSEGDAGRARLARLQSDYLAALTSIPGVREVGATTVMPLGGRGGSGTFLILDPGVELTTFEEFARLAEDPDRTGNASYRASTEGYFRVMGIPLVRGRMFEASDDAAAPHVALISETLARRRWPDEDPIGKLIQFGNMDGDMRPLTVVGVVGDVRERIDTEPFATIYVNSLQRSAALGSSLTFVLETPADPAALLAPVRGATRRVDPGIPARTLTIDEMFSSSLADRRFSLVLLSAFTIAALLLAITGIYGVISYLAVQRRREFGIRMALGATGGTVIGQVVRAGMIPTAIGVGAGLLVAFAATRLLSGMVYGITTTDPDTFVRAPIAIVLVSLAASLLPALRAMRVDPTIAMRGEES